MARDKIHYAVKNALIKDGWTITADPYYLKVADDEPDLAADLAAERPLAAEKGSRKIVVEIKSFLGRSLITEFYSALGQYLTYLYRWSVLSLSAHCSLPSAILSSTTSSNSRWFRRWRREKPCVY